MGWPVNLNGERRRIIGMRPHPLSSLELKNFGPFSAARVDFAPGLNLLLGGNATGKTYVLKAAYALTKSLRDGASQPAERLPTVLTDKLVGTYQPGSLGRLVHRAPYPTEAGMTAMYAELADALSLSFASRGTAAVDVASAPAAQEIGGSHYFGAPEALTQTGGDDTWSDLQQMLARPVREGGPAGPEQQLVPAFDVVLHGGSIVDKDGGFYLEQLGVGVIEPGLMSDSQRTFGMLQRVLANGTLKPGGYIFWDNPDAGLDAAAQNALAQILTVLVHSDIQVFIATHNTDFARTLADLAREVEAEPRFVTFTRDGSRAAALANISVESATQLL